MKKFFTAILLGVLVLFPNTVNATSDKVSVDFAACVDGDTIKVYVNDEKVTVRFLAVDTPETKHPNKPVEPYGKEASDYTCKKVTNAKNIQLEYDGRSGKTDKYGRHLAWVWVDGELLQKDLITQGLAKVAYLYSDYKYTGELQLAEAEARMDGINIWSETEVVTEEEIEPTTSEVKEEDLNKPTTTGKPLIEEKEVTPNEEEENIFVILLLFGCLCAYIYIEYKKEQARNKNQNKTQKKKTNK